MALSAQDSIGSFNASLNRFGVQLEAHLDTLVQHVGFAVAENVVVGADVASGTPVDTGFARASWHVGVGEMPELGIPAATGRQRGKKGGKGKKTYHGAADAVVGNMTLGIARMKAGMHMYLLNNCKYIRRLENGWSLQAPMGMVELTLSSAQAIVDKIARQMGAIFT